MKRIIYREDGGVSVVHPAPKSRRMILLEEIPEDNGIPQYKIETEEQWLERVFTKSTPEGLEYKDIDTETEPLCDRRFRNAWSKGMNGKAIEVNLDKAKVQVFEELRRERDKELVNTDGLMARTNEIGTQEEIDALKVYRQKLRGLPATVGIENIATVAELQAKFPTPEINIAELEAEKVIVK